MSSRVVEPDEVRAILTELVRRLSALGREGSVHVIGGAAIALINPERVATEDVDGYVRLADATDVLLELAREHDLTHDWFNWKAQGLQPPVAGPEMWREVFRDGSVVLVAASTEALLAMKLNAARAKDMNDIIWLLDVLGIADFDEAERIFEHFYPGDGLKPVAQERLKFAIEQVRDSSSDTGGLRRSRALREIDAYYGGQPAPASDVIEGMYGDDLS